MDIIACIPARGGSKRIPYKNTIELDGQPLISYSILEALSSRQFKDVIVTTDDDMIAEISEYYGANVLIRPKKFANDDSIDLEWAKHFYSYYSPDYIAHLRPTTPLRDPDTIKRAINMAKNTKDWDSIVSVQKVGYNPHKLLTLNAGYLQGYLGVYKGYSDKVLGNLPDQKFTPVYRGNGYIDILKKDVILGGSMRGEKILPFFSEYTWEIDEPRDVKYIEFLMNR